MPYPESQLLPISALQHLLFCERQCALIHLEQVWAENRFTIEGQHLHKKAHEGPHETRHGVRIARGLPLRSFELGLIGKADIVEFERVKEPSSVDCPSPNPSLPSPQPSPTSGRGRLRVTPVEYKRGKPKKNDSDRVQLCAQALCLEEMLGVGIETGEIFYGKQRRRTIVPFDERMRQVTVNTARRLHALIAGRKTPIARFEPKCESCSLIEHCLPGVTGLKRSANRVLEKYFTANLQETGPTSDDGNEM